jgi:hypothetical protein
VTLHLHWGEPNGARVNPTALPPPKNGQVGSRCLRCRPQPTRKASHQAVTSAQLSFPTTTQHEGISLGPGPARCHCGIVERGSIAGTGQKARSTLASRRCWACGLHQPRSGLTASDVVDRPVGGFYLYVLPDDRASCPVCVQAHGRVFLPAVVGKVGFSPLDGSCSGAVPCQGLLVGL